jgi:hypothetical protein
MSAYLIVALERKATSFLFFSSDGRYGCATKKRLECIRLTSVCNVQVGNSRYQGNSDCLNIEGGMLQINDDHSANLQIQATAPCTLAVARHGGDHNTAEELSARSHEDSTKATERTEEIAGQTPENLSA